MIFVKGRFELRYYSTYALNVKARYTKGYVFNAFADFIKLSNFRGNKDLRQD